MSITISNNCPFCHQALSIYPDYRGKYCDHEMAHTYRYAYLLNNDGSPLYFWAIINRYAFRISYYEPIFEIVDTHDRLHQTIVFSSKEIIPFDITSAVEMEKTMQLLLKYSSFA